MHLGDLIQRLQAEAGAGFNLEALGDARLAAGIEVMAALHEETAAEYVALAARRFANLAGNEDWLDVIGIAERDPDPARAVLVRMLRWALRRDELEQSARPATCGHRTAS